MGIIYYKYVYTQEIFLLFNMIYLLIFPILRVKYAILNRKYSLKQLELNTIKYNIC